MLTSTRFRCQARGNQSEESGLLLFSAIKTSDNLPQYPRLSGLTIQYIDVAIYTSIWSNFQVFPRVYLDLMRSQSFCSGSRSDTSSGKRNKGDQKKVSEGEELKYASLKEMACFAQRMSCIKTQFKMLLNSSSSCLTQLYSNWLPLANLWVELVRWPY